MTRVIGIDLGTTNSAVAVLEGGTPKVIANSEGSNTTPSVVAFTKDGDTLVGQLAKRQSVTNVDRTISSVKRHMGEKWSKNIDGKNYSPEEISSRVLMKLKTDAESYLGEKVSDAVITVPAYFNDQQRKATQDAGKIAGLNVLRIVNEPTAAALAYGLEKGGDDEKILVYDLGGGTFDVSLLEVSKDDGFSTVEVIATSGDNQLGGDDWDSRLMEWIFDEFKKENGIDLREDKIARQRVKEAAEQAKKELSSANSTQIQLPYITVGDNGALNVDLTLSRAKFEDLTKDLLERTRKPLEQVLADGKVSVSEVNHVVLVGGSTRMPAVVDLVKKITGKNPNQNVNPDEVVAIGAAVQGGVLAGEVKDVLLIDVTPLTLGIRTGTDTMTAMIERNSAIPTQKTEVFTTAVANQPAVTIMVSQGERKVFSGNKLLGQFDLQVAPAPAGVPQIEVKFSIDANGVLDVSAKDLGTGKENRVTVSGGSNLSDSDVEQMIKDAEAHADADARKVREAELLNEAERVVLNADSTLEEFGSKISDSLKSEISSAKGVVSKNIEEKNYSQIEGNTKNLNELLLKVGEEVYREPSQPSEPTSGDDDVVDAEIIDE